MESGYEGVFWVMALAWIGLYVWAVVVCFQKGKSGFGMLGIAAVVLPFVGWFPIVGSLRLAKPSSPWAQKRYGPDKTARARARFPNDAPAVAVPTPVTYATVAAPAAPIPPPQITAPAPPSPTSQAPTSWPNSPPPGGPPVPSTPRRRSGSWALNLVAVACLTVAAVLVIGMMNNNGSPSQAATVTPTSVPTTGGSAATESAVESETRSAWDLDVGDCFDDPASFDEVVSVPAKPCSAPHDNEVYANLDMSDGSFPGGATIEAFAELQCRARFEAYVGRPYETSRLDYGWFGPSARSWSIERDRAVTCFVYDMDLGLLVGSARRSGW